MANDGDHIDIVSLMFEAARSYIGGAKIIMDSGGIKDIDGVRVPTLPVTTCAAFAIEIQLKALLLANSAKRPKGDGHDLQSHFDALPHEVQIDFIGFQKRFTELDEASFRRLLADEKNAFKTWRYPYERGRLETNPAALYHVALALSEYLQTKLSIERSDNGWLRKSSA